ncbi:MAG: YqaA family protein [Alphaproteobacteria bacterium]|jgi:membrane protein YqaA with SNARE-associated domain|nr:YqaA family protein [Alphaproteobacteria bacterium]MDP6567018.1 YqaA family protein [Alphaproteobacteria bacterium]MDP6812197.1 YqaA family protein [Alphaproteobacteria bacterium]
MFELTGPIGLFLAALLAATIFPFQSEALLLALLLAGDHPWWLLLVLASLGNTLGAVINWGLGRFIDHFHDRPWFPVKPAAFARARGLFLRYGLWSLPFAWLPFIGDPLTVVAGAFRVNLLLFVVLVGLGKTARYAVLVAAGQAAIPG